MSSTPHLVMVQSHLERSLNSIFRLKVSLNQYLSVQKDNISVRSELYNVPLIINLFDSMPIIFYSFSNP